MGRAAMPTIDLRSCRLALLVLFAAFCAGACASNGKGAKSLTPESELPEDYAGAWRAWYEDSEAWPDWRPRVAADPQLANFFTDNLIRVMVRHYDRSVIKKAGEMPGLFERSQRELLFLEESAAPKLVELIFVGDSVVSRLCVDLLLRMKSPSVTASVAQRLDSPEPEDRRRAAEWLGSLPHAGKAEESVWVSLSKVATSDPEWFVRAQAALAIGDRSLATGSLDRARAPLSQALSDSDEVVVKSACRALATNGDVRAVPAVINLLDRLERSNTDLALMMAGQHCLTELTGVPGPNESGVWRAWWRENRP